MNANVYTGTGRRKSATARVTLKPGSGKITINKREVKEYLKSDILIKDISQPFHVTNTFEKYDVRVLVSGGGVSGQSGAIRLGIARALLNVSEEFRTSFRSERLLTCDSRVKERKKYGLRKARRARQFSKR